MRRIYVFLASGLVSAFIAGCGDEGLAYRWTDPSVLLGADAGTGADAMLGPDGFVLPDVAFPADRGDVQVIYVDQPIAIPDAGSPPDVQVALDNGSGPDVADAGTPVDTGLDAGSMPDVQTDTGSTPTDLGTDAGFPVDTPPAPDTGTSLDVLVVVDRPTPVDMGVDAGTDVGFDTGPDVRVTPDVPVVVDAGPPPVDVYTGPALRLVYIARNPPSSAAPVYIRYGYDSTYLVTQWAQCPVRLIAGTGNQYECVIDTLPAATTGVWMAAQDICGVDGIGTQCPPSTATTGWRFNYRVEWYGYPYTASSTATTASGPAPAITDHLPAQCGRLRDHCVHAPFPVVRP